VDIGELSLLDCVPELSRDLQAPYHLSDLGYLLDRTEREPVRGLSSVATRHGKTTLIGHHIARTLKRNPKREFVYFTFDADFAGKKNREFRSLAKLAGVTLSEDFNTIKEWRTKEGGGVFACSVGQHVIGRGFHTVLVDDPIGSARDADDAEIRNNVDAAIRFLTSRVHPGGSVIINASRFHTDDPHGRRLLESSIHWDEVTAPAIRYEGEKRSALWPDRWSLEALDKMRAELAVDDPQERTWWAQFMGDPRPPGIDKFGPPTFYTKIPDWSFRIAYGADLAYSQGAHSDFFAMVAIKVCGTKAFVLEIERTKLDAHMIESTCRAMQTRHGTGPIFSYVSGPEVGMVRLMRERGLPFVPLRARYNKLVRAERTIKRWNDGQVMVPADAPQMKPALHRIASFRGDEKDSGDDEVDALVSVCDGAMGGVASGTVKTIGKSYAGFTGLR
jgi:predicted phage terminase large subunit-like protein